jgi:aminoglycoside 6'-N-acetyltransferase I
MEGGEGLEIRIRQAGLSDLDGLAMMRHLLWPESTSEEHRGELETILSSGRYGTLPMAVLVSSDASGSLTGFLEAGLRSHADGCDTAHSVAFIEGWFVHKRFRKQGIGRALVQSAEDWARRQGCTEIASDTWIDDERSQSAHKAVGFEVVDRCVHFRKLLI